MTLVKDEQHFDRFDQVFGSYFNGIEQIIALSPDIPLDWLEKKLQRVLTEEEKAALKKLGGPDALKKRLEEQNKKSGMVARINGLALADPPRLVIAATILKAFALAVRALAIEAQSRFGKHESLKTMTVI